MSLVNDFVIQVATVNGSGSQSSNNVLVRSLFRSGVPVGGKNLFPSNIQGLPTWFNIRVNASGFTGRRPHADICLALNQQTYLQDLTSLRSEGFYFYNAEFKFTEEQKRSDVQMIPLPFREIIAGVTESVKLRKLLINMSYVGVLAELLQIDEAVLDGSVTQQFQGKETVIESNRKAVTAGRIYAQEHLKDLKFPFRVESIKNGNADKILIDGNSSAALGLVFGGASFVSWYPITPSSSLVESFEEFANIHRLGKDGKKTFAVLQAEDELAAISMVLGAGWMGARAMTATSGPGLSLMAEAAGLAYYAEIPSVIWDVQRVGPSTGLPTRTMQGDLQAAYTLSHGDAKHIVLLPGNNEECFEFGRVAFDLAERLQTLVIVLSDLDLGMNFAIANKFKTSETAFDRGKVLTATDLEKTKTFSRYKDVDGDGIPYRTLPGIEHPLASYFTRGTGHDEEGRYTEDPMMFKKNMDRLNTKWETARTLAPKPVTDNVGAKTGLLAFGSTDQVMKELRDTLGTPMNYLRLRALPLSKEVETFLKENDRVYILEQNRDGQLIGILRSEFPEFAMKLESIRVYDGMPVAAEDLAQLISEKEKR
jgi:2-oxoglutarate/2-oxoacid ferredoxin oxidoreductase subunit alpha